MLSCQCPWPKLVLSRLKAWERACQLTNGPHLVVPGHSAVRRQASIVAKRVCSFASVPRQKGAGFKIRTNRVTCLRARTFDYSLVTKFASHACPRFDESNPHHCSSQGRGSLYNC